jgi:ABC-type sugar transport system permease subunit
MKNKWVGLTTILAFYIAYCFGLRFHSVLFYDTGMILPYLIGAWIGVHHFEWFTTRKSKAQSILGLAIFILCCVFHGFSHLMPKLCHILQLPLVIILLSCGAFWNAFDLFDLKTYPEFAEDSFLIYAGHSLVGATVSKVISILLPKGHFFTVLTAVLAFPATVVILCVCGRVLKKFFPRLKRILTGK